MILELYQLGQLVSAGQAVEAQYVQEIEKVKRPIKGVKNPRYQLLPIHFNLDEQRIETTLSVRLRDVRHLWEIGAVRFGAPRGRKHYPAVLFPKNINQWEVSLFGAGEGESDLLKWCAGKEDADLRFALEGIQEMVAVYQDWLGEGDLFNKLKAFDTKAEPIAVIYACVSSKERGWSSEAPPALAEIGNYQALYQASQAAATDEGLCYFSGEQRAGVVAPDSTNRYNLNKLFVTTTFNYAVGFEKDNYADNYQISPAVFQALEAGSEFLLKKGSPLQIRIADLPHVVLPRIITFEEENPLDEEFLETINTLNLSLFSYLDFSQLINELQFFGDESDPTTQTLSYSLTYVAFESDGNSTKVINTIREVQDWQFARVREQLMYINHLFAPWLPQQGINLYSIFQQLPIIKGTKRNIGLQLLGDLLENKTINEQLLFQYCSEALNCHRYGRYKAYDHPSGNPDTDKIWYYARTVTYYGALRLLLYRLGQLKNNHHIQPGVLTGALEYDIDTLKNSERMEQEYEVYFQRLGYNIRHRALFYLGRALDRVAYNQYKKKNSKTVLNALDFSGMDKKKIVQLAAVVENKAQLYRLEQGQRHLSVLDQIVGFLDQFSSSFDLANWDQRITLDGKEVAPVTGKEAVFYIMSGYTYGAHKRLKKEDAENDDAEAMDN